MAGFVGYIVHANDIRFPWDKVAMAAPKGLSPQELWDVTPEAAKWQIILTIAFLEFWRENSYILSKEGEQHYMRGGKPGYFPTFSESEIKHGRVAMAGFVGYIVHANDIRFPWDKVAMAAPKGRSNAGS